MTDRTNSSALYRLFHNSHDEPMNPVPLPYRVPPYQPSPIPWNVLLYYQKRQRLLKPKRFRWTPDLHARFVQVIKNLDGRDRITPKSIHRHMDTNDVSLAQIKSHLQKFRQCGQRNVLTMNSRVEEWEESRNEEARRTGSYDPRTSRQSSSIPGIVILESFECNERQIMNNVRLENEIENSLMQSQPVPEVQSYEGRGSSLPYYTTTPVFEGQESTRAVNDFPSWNPNPHSFTSYDWQTPFGFAPNHASSNGYNNDLHEESAGGERSDPEVDPITTYLNCDAMDSLSRNWEG